ncbi:RNase adapter RapZ [Sinimarinibacterium sp. CAU 1509]|uniref:RNase adapter RapZ n=1 Tax=Sinimarinibacterium sp. CAU 1509 TaxID=2562283 RepID=UPI0010AB9E74|nr:RNase adapter RapZ [Sinimarinibacterium sp. CAU 1509]TJY56690.1 RNase adapter RapZ [Sinimarinibacterium sp. CAU 1509]
MKLVIVSGLSGAGKTVALKQYEDIGYHCIDNLPLLLLGPLSRHGLKSADERYERLAISVDARESPQQIARFPRYLQRLHDRGIQTHVLFLRADTTVLLQRYSETRRRHPLAHGDVTLADAIELEQSLLSPIANLADATIDTTLKNLHGLREEILSQVPGGGSGKLSIQFESFGFRNGIPTDADFVFDVRCLPNPHWEPELRALSGRDAPVAAWLGRDPAVVRMVDDIRGFLDRWLPELRKQDRAYLTIAIGCTGGQHRSVFVVETLAADYAERLDQITVRHRELWRGQQRQNDVEKKN